MFYCIIYDLFAQLHIMEDYQILFNWRKLYGFKHSIFLLMIWKKYIWSTDLRFIYFVVLQVYVYIIFTQPPPLGQDMTQGQFLSGV